MAHNYMSGLIGLDVKKRRRTRIRKNSYRYSRMQGFILASIVTVMFLGLLLFGGAR